MIAENKQHFLAARNFLTLTTKPANKSKQIQCKKRREEKNTVKEEKLKWVERYESSKKGTNISELSRAEKKEKKNVVKINENRFEMENRRKVGCLS